LWKDLQTDKTLTLGPPSLTFEF